MKRRYAYLSIMCFLAFFVRAAPHLFVIPYAGIEEGSQLFFSQRLVEGDFRFLRQYPQTHILLIAGLSLVTGLSVETVGFYWNPFMAALTVLAFYFLLRDGIKVKTPLIGCLLLTFLPIHIYRSTLLNGSEATGILFMITTLYLFYTRTSSWSLLMLPLLFVTHLIAFGAVCLVLLFNLLTRRWNPLEDKKTIVVLGLFAVIGLMYFPYTLTFGSVSAPSNVTFSYDVNDLTWLLASLPGVVILPLLGLFDKNQEFGINRHIIITLLALGGVSLFLYSPFFSVYRVFPYLALFGIMGVSNLGVNKLLMGALVCVMASGLVVGWPTHNRIFDHATEEELEIIQVLKTYDGDLFSEDVLYDDVGTESVVSLMPSKRDPFAEKDEWDILSANTAMRNLALHGIVNFTGEFRYIIYNKNRPYLFRTVVGGRVLYRPYEIPDVWKTLPDWEPLFTREGVIVYERSG